MSDKVYDVLATIQRILAPLAVFLAALCGIWGWTEYAEQIAATISAVSVLLAAILKIKSNEYFAAGNITFLNPELHKD